MFLGANGEPVEGAVQKSGNGGWVDGGSNPFLKGKEGEDPIASAAQEMAATSAAYALQKAQLMGAGMGGLLSGGAPSVEAMANFNRNGVEPPSNPYQHLSRDEKIAMITQLQKSKVEREARGEQSPTDMVDPAEELAKSAAPGVLPPKKTQKQAAPPPVAPTADRAVQKSEHGSLCKCGECMAKGGKAAAPMSATHLTKPEKSPIERKEEQAALGPKVNMRKSMDFALQAFNVATSEDGLRKSFDVMTKCMGGMSNEYSGTPFEKEALDLTIEYKKAVLAIRKEKLDEIGSQNRWKKLDLARDAYYSKLDALEIKKLEHKRKMLDMSKAVPQEFNDLLAKAGVDLFADLDDDVENVRPGPVLNVTGLGTENPAPGGSSAEEREATHPDPLQTLSKASKGEGSKGGKVIGHTPSGEPVYASDQQGAVAHHKSMESLHKEKAKEAHDKTPKGQFNASHFAEQRKHEEAAKEHAHAAFQHENRGKLGMDEKTNTKQSNRANKLTAAIHTEAAAGHKSHQEWHEKQTGPGGPDPHNVKMAGHNKLKAEQHEKAAKQKFSSHEAFKKSMTGGNMKPEQQTAIDELSAFASETLKKSEGQGGMPEAGGPPSEMPTTRRAVDGGELAGVGAPTGPQSPPETTVASTSHAGGTGEEENLRALSEVHGVSGVQKADLESEAGGSKLQKGWVDWNQAADDGEYLRAQLVGQLMNKSLDISPAISGKREAPAPVAEEKPEIYFQKGGAAIYMDNEDRRIEKAMNRVPGTTFSQGSQANLGAPVQHEATCMSCGSLTKSFLSSCTECGVSLQGHRYEAQGLRLEKSVADTLIPTDEDDVSIG